MDSKNNSPLFESKTLLAVVAMGFIFLGWQYYLQSKYPNYYKPKTVQKTEQQTGLQSSDPAAAAKVGSEQGQIAGTLNTVDGTTAAAPIEEKTFQVSHPEFTAQLTSRGMSLREINLKNHVNRDGTPIVLSQGQAGSFETRILGQTAALNFNIEQPEPTIFVGRASFQQTQITKKMALDPSGLFWNVEISLDKVDSTFPGLQTWIAEKRTIGASSFFAPSMEHQEVVFSHEGAVQRLLSSGDLDSPDQAFKGISFAAISLRYFTLALVDSSTVLPELTTRIPDVEGKDIDFSMIHKFPQPTEQAKLQFKFFAGPKKIEVLASVDPQLNQVVDLGFFTTIGKVLRNILQWFFSYVGNWGVAIILLTIVVRIVVLPFNIVSYRSMKAMQVIQPAMQAVREKYKEDPAAMQRETMALMKEHKVNPFGGCLPMLLQMPVFFALFQLLNVSVELYQAPFYLWITDLSVKDPFFVLPVLIGGLIYIQQQLTPAPMDPAQAKILKWMPLLFVGFMVSLPAGLSIYTLVNTLFGVVQQWFFMRQSPAIPSAGTTKVLKENRV